MLDEFEVWSGLRIILAKSNVYMAGVPEAGKNLTSVLKRMIDKEIRNNISLMRSRV